MHSASTDLQDANFLPYTKLINDKISGAQSSDVGALLEAESRVK
jgi:hypothetical protein